MYSRIIQPHNKSFFLFGPRGTGKTTWLKTNFKQVLYLDLLESELFNDLLAAPQRLEQLIPPNYKNWIIIDEVQRVPALLFEIHRLIESRKLKFILTGSSARKLKQREINLLAGRAFTSNLYPLTAAELGKDFNLEHSLLWGHLPSVFQKINKKNYLESYISNYLQQEIQQEGLTRNLAGFARFLEAASFSQGGILNISEIARECSVHRKVAESYFQILEDLMIGYFLPVFTKKAKRRIVSHPKFYFFDVGVYRTLRPKGPLDTPEELQGAALETLVFQEIKATNSYLKLGYKIFYWRTPDQLEVDFVLYGERGMKAIEVKRTSKINSKDLRGVRAFLKDYPMANAFVLYGGPKILYYDKIKIIPVEKFLTELQFWLKS